MADLHFPKPTREMADRLRALAPDAGDVFRAFSKAVLAEGALDTRTKQLIAVAAEMRAGKKDLADDDRIKEVAPSTELRKWFDHDADKWQGFRDRHRAELDANDGAVSQCLNLCRKGRVVMHYGAKDREQNQAMVLRDYLRERWQDHR